MNTAGKMSIAARWSILGAIAVTALAFCASGLSLIVPGISIAGVRLGDSRASVRAILGPPPQVKAGRLGHVDWGYVRHGRGDIGVGFDRGRVTQIFIGAIPKRGVVLAERTSKGIGLGSPMSAVDRAYPGRCYFPNAAANRPPVCNFSSGTTMMLFQASGRFGIGRNAPVETIILFKR